MSATHKDLPQPKTNWQGFYEFADNEGWILVSIWAMADISEVNYDYLKEILEDEENGDGFDSVQADGNEGWPWKIIDCKEHSVKTFEKVREYGR